MKVVCLDPLEPVQGTGGAESERHLEFDVHTLRSVGSQSVTPSGGVDLGEGRDHVGRCPPVSLYNPTPRFTP